MPNNSQILEMFFRENEIYNIVRNTFKSKKTLKK